MWREIDWVIPGEAREAFFAGDGMFRGEQWRKRLAALNTKYSIGLTAASFGYADDGAYSATSSDTLAFSVKGGKVPSTVRLTALSEQAALELENCSTAVLAALILETRSMVKMFTRSGEFSAERLPYPQTYLVGQMCVGDKGKAGRTLWSDMNEQVKAGKTWPEVADRKLPYLIADSITDTLRRDQEFGADAQGSLSERLGMLIGSKATTSEIYREMRELMGIKVSKVERTFTLTREFSGKKIPRFLLVGVHFTAKVQLSGPFFAGKDRINGFGRITTPILGQGNLETQEADEHALHE